MKIVKRKRRKSVKKRSTVKKRTVKRIRRKRTVKKNPITGVKTMKRRKRRSVKRRRHSARRVKRNPSFSMKSAGGFVDTLMGGAVAGAGGILVVKVSDAICKLMNKSDAQTKNMVKLGLTLASGFFLPKYVKSSHAKSLVDGMATVTAMSILNTSFGMNISLNGADDQLDEIVKQLEVSGISEVSGTDYDTSMLGYDASDMLGVAEVGEFSEYL